MSKILQGTIMKKRRSDQKLADDIVSLLNSEQDTARHPDMKIKSLLQQARDAGDGPLRLQYLQQARKEIAKLDQARNRARINQLHGEVLALQGRGGDTRIAHVRPGEIIIPRSLQTQEVLTVLQIIARAHGIDPSRLQVGNRSNSINPRTGQIEFQDGGFDPNGDQQQDPDGDGYHDADGNPIEGITVTTPPEPTIWDDVRHPIDAIARAISEQIAQRARANPPTATAMTVRG
jgi:hypothetical protein